MIIQHRRGATSDWKTADILADQLPEVILKDGEFAIEELTDGSRRVRIGDGQTKFLELPYIDAPAEAIAKELVQRVKTDLQTQIAELSAAQKLLRAGLSATEEKIESSITEVATAYEVADAAVLTEAKKESTELVNQLHKELQEELTGVSTSTAAAIEILDETTTKKFSDLTTKTGQIQATLTELETTASYASTQISDITDDLKSLETALSESATSTEERFTSIKQDLAKLDGDVTADIESLEDRITQDFTNKTTVIQSSLGELNNQVVEYANQILAVDQNLNTLSGEVDNNKIEMANQLSEVERNIAGLTTTVKTKILPEIADLEETINIELDKVKGQHDEKFELINTVLEDRVSALDNKITLGLTETSAIINTKAQELHEELTIGLSLIHI